MSDTIIKEILWRIEARLAIMEQKIESLQSPKLAVTEIITSHYEDQKKRIEQHNLEKGVDKSLNETPFDFKRGTTFTIR